MVKVNLIGKKRREAKGRNWIIIVGSILYIGFLIYFFASVIIVVYRLSSLNSQLDEVELETQTISAQMLKNNELLNKYVLSKFILGKLQSLDSSRFRYKDYLDQIANLMPAGVLLKNVDFSIPGWVSVLASTQNVGSLGTLEKLITNSSIVGKSVFASIYSENVARDNSGGYNVKLQFEIRKNGGK